MFFYDASENNLMEKVCYSCKYPFPIGSMKTSRTRFKLMGIIPPEGMGISDKICSKCLHEMYDKQIKQDSLIKLKKNMEKIFMTCSLKTVGKLND